MEVTMLRDKLNTGMRLRIDDLTINEFVRMKSLIEKCLQENELFIKTLSEDEKLFGYMKEDIETYKNILSSMKNEKTVQLDCYRGDTENESFATMVKKYKKVK